MLELWEVGPSHTTSDNPECRNIAAFFFFVCFLVATCSVSAAALSKQILRPSVQLVEKLYIPSSPNPVDRYPQKNLTYPTEWEKEKRKKKESTQR